MVREGVYLKIMGVMLVLGLSAVQASDGFLDEQKAIVSQPNHSQDLVQVGEDIFVRAGLASDFFQDVDTLEKQQEAGFYPLTQARYDRAYLAHCKVYGGQAQTVTCEEKADLILLFIATESLLRWQGLASLRSEDTKEGHFSFQPASVFDVMSAFSKDDDEACLETPSSRSCQVFLEALKSITPSQEQTVAGQTSFSFFILQAVMMNHSLITLLER